ncbi:hypothetical protein RvY_02464 [Ramazzottius varieornatus]|uniref:Uncharacterized protein n=1 Tax=Ramazzottius varieornatus TaxID=947166 RepID=A0A1D1UN60_RAMVA|nr:hypothetical protein RvY_02464 [Ramazzottius varieornatus]
MASLAVLGDAVFIAVCSEIVHFKPITLQTWSGDPAVLLDRDGEPGSTRYRSVNAETVQLQSPNGVNGLDPFNCRLMLTQRWHGKTPSTSASRLPFSVPDTRFFPA